MTGTASVLASIWHKNLSDFDYKLGKDNSTRDSTKNRPFFLVRAALCSESTRGMTREKSNFGRISRIGRISEQGLIRTRMMVLLISSNLGRSMEAPQSFFFSLWLEKVIPKNTMVWNRMTNSGSLQRLLWCLTCLGVKLIFLVTFGQGIPRNLYF